ncbi:CIH_collapsed_G0025780.mRNA.1.CDS.1 [Saccharomyces cerevisiae]|nr:CIH_collapsed_G0025780.mRNA.1.CDS.1 [Saccharomyces cerevisiae]
MAKKVAICTLLYSRDYLPGALTLAYQLQKLLKHAVVEDEITLCPANCKKNCLKMSLNLRK